MKKYKYATAVIAIFLASAGVIFLWNKAVMDHPPGDTGRPDQSVSHLGKQDHPIEYRSDAINQYFDVNSLSGDARQTTFLDIQLRAESGDAVSQRILSEIYSDCKMYSANREGFLDIVRHGWLAHKHESIKLESFLSDLINLCDQVDGGAMIPANAISEWRSQAAMNGDLIAQVQDLYMRFDNYNSQDVERVVDSVIKSGDPNALLEIFQLMARPVQLSNKAYSNFSGSEQASASWAIAACRRGANCGPNSRIMRQVCLLEGECDFSSFDGYIFSRFVAPGSRQQVEDDVAAINALIGH
jgi:hypothetical protein